MEFRKAADWQLNDDLKEDNPFLKYGFYFKNGLWSGRVPLHKHPDFQLEKRPSGIEDIRSNKPTTGGRA